LFEADWFGNETINKWIAITMTAFPLWLPFPAINYYNIIIIFYRWDGERTLEKGAQPPFKDFPFPSE